MVLLYIKYDHILQTIILHYKVALKTQYATFLSSSLTGKPHKIAQKHCRKQLNTKVCGKGSAEVYATTTVSTWGIVWKQGNQCLACIILQHS